MATTHPLPATPAAVAPGAPEVKDGDEASGARALAPVQPLDEAVNGESDGQSDGMILSGPVALLPVELDVVVPVREFRVRHLLALKPGQLIESQWTSGNDVPLASGKVQLAWSEFEVVDSLLAVRVTRLA